MTEITPPIHSTKTLIISSLIAVIGAFIILITFIAPAEYGIDPTGLGKRFGLMELSKPPVAISQKAHAQQCPTGDLAEKWQDIVLITIPAHSTMEYKFSIQQQEILEYEWQSTGAALYFDFHGEPAGDTTGYFKSYQIDSLNHVAAKQIMPFTGRHGWYWNNKSDQAVQITLKTKGKYQIKGLM